MHLQLFCPVCGKDIEHGRSSRSGICGVCGKEYSSYYFCPEGHNICDKCFIDALLDKISPDLKKLKTRDPIEAGFAIMNSAGFPIKGCAHYLVPPIAILIAYSNIAKDKIFTDRGRAIFDEAFDKSPMSLCRINGSCGIPYACGETLTLLMPYLKMQFKDGAIGNKLTTECLTVVAKNNEELGKCCVRNTYLSILTTAKFFDKYMWVEMELPTIIKCRYSKHNPKCKKEDCKFYNGYRTIPLVK
ncbi:MAG: DUF5714 domain-containing protein [Methanocorpusculum sp.]|nr:DUF5714 domain-containing protein [Methanocorpusculum sp.]